MLYVIYQDEKQKIIVLNNRYSKGRLRMKLLLKTDFSEEMIREIVSNGIFLSGAKTLTARGYGTARMQQQNIVTVFWPGQKLIIYPDAHIERKYPLRNVIEGWFKRKMDNVKSSLLG